MSELLARYDHDERFAATSPDVRREELEHLVRQVDLVGHTGCVIYSHLSPETTDPAIADQIAYFQSIGQDFEWKVFAHDHPPDLVQRLTARGFEIDETEAIMVLDIHDTPPELFTPWSEAERGFSPTPKVKRLRHLDELRDVSAVKPGVHVVERLAYEMEHAPEYVSVYVAYADDAPAACGWIRFPPASVFASLWGGATLPNLRNRGFYTQLLAARIQEARDRGWRYVTIDAGAMSRPIVEKRGFRLLTYATACTWHHG